MRKIFIALTVMIAGLAAGCEKSDQADIPVTGISIEKNLTLNVGQTKNLPVTILPEKATQKVTFVWSSSTDAAEVDAAGTLKALKKGNAVITVKVSGNESVKAECTLTVTDGDESDPNEVLSFEDNKFAALALLYDTNNDGQLQRSEAEAVKKMNVDATGILSLKGIEYFTGLEMLDCGRNSLKSLDVSKNTKLKELYCHSNQIAELEVATLKDLQKLNCRGNHLSKIDVSQNPELVALQCGMNNGGMYDGLGITEVDVTKNPKLEVLDVYYLNIQQLDVTKNPKLKWLDFGYCCHTLWDRKPIEQIDLSNNPELEYLNCVSSVKEGFGLNALDVTHNPKLRSLSTYGNPKIAKLDLSKNPELRQLNCCHNALTELDITACPLLDTLSCQYNDIAVLDLKNNAQLVYVNCADNRIGMLDFSNTKLGYLLAQNNRIAEIDMGDKTFDTPSASNTGYDDAGQPYLYMKLNNNLIESIDLSKQTYLAWLEINSNRLTSLDVNNCTKLHGLLCANNLLTELKLDKLTGIWELDCSGNRLGGTLDVSGLKNAGPAGLSRMAAQGNQLQTIRVWEGFNPDATYLLGGVGTLPCYTKDAATVYEYVK